ncbi:MAG: GAF domain-containing protein [Halobacteriales archaeon]
MSDAVILCVDPDEATRAETIDELAAELDALDPTFEGAGSIADAEGIIGEVSVDCVITEYDLPDGTGLDLVDRIRETAPDAGCILFTAADHETIDTEAFHGAITEYLNRNAPQVYERLAGLVRTTITLDSQTSYPHPQEETERVAALRTFDLDAAGVHESLERITDLAGEHFDVEKASINVIDEHSQDFLACYGEAKNWERTEREDSICTFTIVEDDPVMTVEDVHEDPRFETNEKLEDLGIRAYMGASIRSPSGLAIGTLCIYDDEPRTFSEAERSYLHTLAQVAMDLIEAHYRDAQVAAEGRDDAGDEEGAGE